MGLREPMIRGQNFRPSIYEQIEVGCFASTVVGAEIDMLLTAVILLYKNDSHTH